MKLPGHEPGMIRQLDDLNEVAGLIDAGDDQPRFRQLGAIAVVDLVAVAVALLYLLLPVSGVRMRPAGRSARHAGPRRSGIAAAAHVSSVTAIARSGEVGPYQSRTRWRGRKKSGDQNAVTFNGSRDSTLKGCALT